MALHLIYGRSGSGKTNYCLNEILKRLSYPSDTPLLWILPEHETFKMERLLAQKSAERGFSRAYVLGFKRLAYRVLAECGGAVKKHITALGKRLLVNRVLRERADEWQAFARAVRQRNFSAVLVELLEELKVYGVSGKVLEEAAADLGMEEDLKQKLGDLALAWRELDAKMADAYQDNEDYMDALAVRLPKSKLARGCVYIDGFRFFNPQELAVLRVFLQMAKQVTVTLCMDDAEDERHGEETDLFFRQYRTRKRLLQLAAAQNLAVEEIELAGGARYKNPSLHILERFLYQYHTPRAASGGGVRLLEAANRRRELEGVAADILRVRRERGCRWRDIAVLVRDEEAYLELCEGVFDDYGIPYFSERKRPALHHPLAELLRSSLSAIDGWRYEPLFRVFKTGFFAPAEEIDLLENYVLAYGIRGARWTQAEDWAYGKRPETEENGADGKADGFFLINDIRRRVAAPLLSLQQKTAAGARVRDMLRALYEFLEELDVPQKLEQAAWQAERAGHLDEATQQRQIWDGVVAILEQMEEICGQEELSREDVAALMEDALDSLAVSLVPPGLDYVTIASFAQNSVANTKAVYIVGLNEGSIPRKAKTEGLLNDSDRQKLAEFGVELPAGAGADNFSERFLVYSAFSKASEYLVCSYALSNQEGEALLPSPLAGRLRELLPLSVETLLLDTASSGERLLGKPRRSLAFLAEAFCTARKNGAPVPNVWRAVYNWALKNGQTALLDTFLAGLKRPQRQEKLPQKLAQSLYLSGGRLRGSVTRFEEFQKCPFQHFADYGLKLKERDIFIWQVNELGTLMHAVLRSFGEELRAANRLWGSVTEAECADLCHRLVREIAPQLKNEILFSSAYYRHLLARMERAAKKSLWRLIRLDLQGKFHPLGYEKAFGSGKEFAPLTYPLKDGSILEVRGQIDRIDGCLGTDGNLYIVIMDYKTGSMEIQLAEVYYGLKLQLLTYLLASCSELQKKSGRPVVAAGMLYFFLKTQLLSCGGRRSAADIEKEIDKTFKMPGWMLANKKIVRSFDGKEQFLPISFDKKDEFTKVSRRHLKTEEEFGAMLLYIRRILAETGERILAGDIAVRPYRLGKADACQYCRFSAVCRYDALLDEGASRALSKCGEEEAMAHIFEALAADGRLKL